MRKASFLLFLLAAGLAVSPTVKSGAQEEHLVVTTLSFLADLTKGIGGSAIEVKTLISGSVDPHNYEPTPSDLTALTAADMIITSGQEEFDGWFNDFLVDNPTFVSKVYEIESSKLLRMDPLVGELNPHYWLSPMIMKTIAEDIFEKLNESFQIGSEGLNSMNSKIDRLMETINRTREEIGGLKVVVDHPAFFYFLDLLGIERVAAIEEKEGVDPSPSHIQNLVELMLEQNITQVIASEIQAGSDVIELASKTGARISYLNVNPSQINGTGYVNMMETNIERILDPVEPNTDSSTVPVPYAPIVFSILLAIEKKKKKRRIYHG